MLKIAINQGKGLAIIREIALIKEQQSKYNSDKFNLEDEILVNAEHLKELEKIAAKKQQNTDNHDD